jgi:hypothetical protein
MSHSSVVKERFGALFFARSRVVSGLLISLV